MSTAQQQFERYLSFIKADPTNLQLIVDTAQLAYDLQHYQRALELAAQGVALQTDHQELLSLLALSHLSLGQVDEAQLGFEQLYTAHPQDPAIRYNLAYCMALKEEFAQALPLLEDALAQYESLPPMLHLKIRALYFIEELEQAIALCHHALELQPNDGKVHELLSSLYIDTNDFATAEQHAAIALQTNPNFSLAHTSRGTAALSTQDDMSAMRHFDQAISLNQQDGRAWLGKGMALMLQSNLNEAEASFKHAIKHMPTHQGSYQALAWCQISQGHVDDADATVRQAMALDETFSENHGTLAVLATMQGNISLAEVEAKIALRLDKASFSGNYAQALIQQAQGNAKQAQQMIDAMLDHPDMINNQSLRQFVTQHRAKQTIH